jgi:type VI protein secretion system component Hcp
MNLKKLGLAIMVLGILLLAVDAAAQKTTAYLKISGSKARFKIAVDATKWSQVRGMPDPRTLAFSPPKSAGDKTGSVQMGDLSIVKQIDRSSPRINTVCAQGEHIDEVTIEFQRASGDRQTYFKITMQSVFVSSVQPGSGGTGSDSPLETVSFRYKKVKWEYSSPDDDDF